MRTIDPAHILAAMASLTPRGPAPRLRPARPRADVVDFLDLDRTVDLVRQPMPRAA